MKRKMVKKLISASLVSVMAASMLSACGGGSDNSGSGDGGSDSESGGGDVLKVAAFAFRETMFYITLFLIKKYFG